jgi:hypothetical protein
MFAKVRSAAEALSFSFSRSSTCSKRDWATLRIKLWEGVSTTPEPAEGIEMMHVEAGSERSNACPPSAELELFFVDFKGFDPAIQS